MSLAIIGMVIAFTGCQQETPQKYRLSDKVQELSAELQADIQTELTKYSGTPATPILLRIPPVEGEEPEDQGPVVSLEKLKNGEAVYRKRCQQCHGVSGDGNGPEAQFLSPLPRDYRRGVYKFTSTSNRAKPRRSDLIRTLRNGIPGTAMPAFDRLSKQDLEDVVDYVLALTHRGELERYLLEEAINEEEIDPEYVPEIIAEILEPWQEAEFQLVTPPTPVPAYSEETVEAGRQAFVKAECYKCHGIDGRGGSVGVDVGLDDWGQKAAAADLTSGMYRGGGRPVDLYRRIHAGIAGSPMPAFSNVFEEDPDAIWNIVHFIKDVGQRRRKNLPPEPFASPKELAEIAKANSGEPDAEGDSEEEEAEENKEDSAADSEGAADTEGAADSEGETEETDSEDKGAETPESESTDTSDTAEESQPEKEAEKKDESS